MTTQLNVSVIGAGKMGQALIRRLAEIQDSFPTRITVTDPKKEALVQMERLSSNIHGVASVGECAVGADVIVLCVKPKHMNMVAKELAGGLSADCVVVSILAGVSVASLQKALGHEHVVRAMPNTPGQIGQGVSGWTSSTGLSNHQRELAQTILATLGEEIYFADESHLDIVTAISGSGPGLVYICMESMEDAAVQLGLPRDIAHRLVTQTVLGSGAYAKSRKGVTFAELRHEVVSPGGTTAEGSFSLEESGFRAAIIRAIIAMWRKCQALGLVK